MADARRKTEPDRERKREKKRREGGREQKKRKNIHVRPDDT